MRRVLLIFGLGLLAALLALVILAEFFSERPRRFTGRLADALPAEVAGWTRRDIPIAASSAMSANVQGILNYSQAVQAIYVRNSRQILVYVAYWEPGKVSVVDAGSHNPDSCWVNNGCVRTERRYAVAGAIDGRALHPYEYGQYVVPAGGRQTVVFWHLVNGEPNRYEDQEIGWRAGLRGRLERFPLLWKDLREHGLNQKNEQMFIRVSSSLPLADMMNDPDIQRLLQGMEKLGIFKDKEWR